MTVITGADLVLRDAVLSGHRLVIDDGVIVAIDDRRGAGDALQLHGLLLIPGFVDVHVHGVEGFDALDGDGAIEQIAARLPRYGVTTFCPTSVACSPGDLTTLLRQTVRARAHRPAGAARVACVHLESNFINPEYCGAQPLDCLRQPPIPENRLDSSPSEFFAEDILAAIDRAGDAVGIVTLAPELPGALSLIEGLVAAGRRVSLGHSAATYEQAMAGMDAGARHVTHLFNRMPPLHHRAPGLAGAALVRSEVAVEIICDGVHVHPALVHLARCAKSADGVIAITDAAAWSGLPPGSRARIGGRVITVADVCYLEDGTIAGAARTMDENFRWLVEKTGASLVEAARMSSTTPARAIGRDDIGELRVGAAADFVALDRALTLEQTWIAGECVYSRSGAAPLGVTSPRSA